MIDQRPDDYPVERLLELRTAHEAWVQSRLQESRRVAIRRRVPQRLPEVTDAGALLRIVGGAHESSLHHDELKSEVEVELVGGFLQDLHDFGDLWTDLEPAARVQAQYSLSRSLGELIQQGWRVFGARTAGRIGPDGDDDAWESAFVYITRHDNRDIVGAADS